jgi:hypothetical protein
VELLTSVERAYGIRFSNAELTTLTQLRRHHAGAAQEGVEL